MKFQLNSNNSKLILKESTREEYNQLKNYLTPFVKDYRFMDKFKYTAWDGKFDYFNNGYIDFGLWKEVHDVCKTYGYPFQILNKEQFPRDNDITLEKVKAFCDEFYEGYKDDKGVKFKPHPHQVEAVYRVLKNKFGLVSVATSGGKSLIFSTVVFYILKHIKPDAKILLIVPGIDLVTQFYNEMTDYNIGFNKEQKNPFDLKIQEIMSETPRKVRPGEEPNVCIGTYQSLINYGTPELLPDFFKQFDIVAVDESHKAKAKQLTTILKRTFGTAQYRFGLSGSYPPAESSELLAIESVTGPKLITVKARELMDKGLISNVKVKALILQYEDKQFAQSVYAIKKSGNGRKALELEKKYAQGSEKRKIFLGKLVNKFKQNSLVLFFNIEYGTMLYNYFRDNLIGKDFYYIDGETPKEKREYIKKQMEMTDGNVKVLVASYGTLSTGVNIKAITNMVLADSFKSTQLIIQSIGRALRLHKEKLQAIIFDIVDQFYPANKNILYNHFLIRRDQIYKIEEYPYEEIKIII